MVTSQIQRRFDGAVEPPKPRATRAQTDAQVLRMWLHSKSPSTIEAYARDVRQFFAVASCSLSEVKLEDVQGFADTLADLAPSSQARKLAAVKSLLTFASKIGYIPFNVGAAVNLPKAEDGLSERILSESEVQRIVNLEPKPRNRAMLRIMYSTGMRVSEASGLRWRHVQAHKDAGVLTVQGKGSKTRTVRLNPEAWAELETLRAEPDTEVFRSQKGGALSRSRIWAIVKNAAERAGIDKDVSPHFLRHSHASHALDRGAPVHLVKDTLGHSSLTTTSRYAHARPEDSSSYYLSL